MNTRLLHFTILSPGSRSSRVAITEIVTGDEGAEGKGNKGQEGHPN